MSRKWKAVQLAVIALVAPVVACSAPPGGATVDSARDETGPVTLQVMGLERGSFLRKAIEQFERDHPNISIEFTNQQPVFEDGSVQTVLRSGGGPDVLDVSTGPARVGELIASGLLPEVDDVYESEDLETVTQPYVLDQLKRYSGEHFYEVVVGIDVFQVYYNKQIFSDLGLRVPQTWNEFLQVCERVKEAGILPIATGLRDSLQGGWMFGQIVQAVAGKDVMSDIIYGHGEFDQDAMTEAARTLKGLVDQGYIVADQAAALDSQQSRAEFFAGRAAMSFLGQTHLIRASSSEGVDISPFSSFLLPSPNEGQAAAATGGLGTSWIVNPGTDSPNAAREWLRWMASEEFLRIAMASGDVPSIPSRVLPEDVKPNDVLADAASKLDNAGYNPSVFLPSRVVQAWYGAPQTIVTGQASPEQAMAAIQVEMARAREG